MAYFAGLIDAAPVGPDDFCKNTRELVAMKCLEKLHAQGVKLHASSSSTLDSKIGLDFSHTCEHVLQEVSHEVKQFIIFSHLIYLILATDSACLQCCVRT